MQYIFAPLILCASALKLFKSYGMLVMIERELLMELMATQTRKEIKP